MEDGEIKKSPAIDEVINVSYKMLIFILLCLTLFLPVATDIESEIAQRIAELKSLVEYNDSHPHFIECVVNRNNCLPEEIPYLKLLEPPEKLLIWSKRNVHMPLSLIKDQFFKEKLIDKKAFLSKVEYFITYIGNQIRSVQFLKLIAIIPLALLCVITACYAKYLIFIILLALLILTSFTDARPIEKMSIYENTAPNLHVNHFDCSKMISNQMYSLNKVAPCEIRPDKISTNQARVNLYQRNYKVKLEATMCKATQQQLRWFCDSFDSSGIDARHNTITTSVKLDAQKCKLAKERKKIKLSSSSKSVEFEFDKSLFSNFNSGDVGTGNNECNSRGWITHYTYETYMQNVSLNVNLRDGTVNYWQNIPLPCPLSAGGCDSTSTDPFAYTWDEPNNCFFTIIRTFDAQMIKANDKYYIEKDPKFTSAQSDFDLQSFMFQVYNKPQSFCSHPRIVYPTPYDSLYISLRDGLDMNTGEPIHKFKPDTGAITLKDKIYSSDNKTVDTTYSQVYENIDFEAHLGTKIDYLHFNNLRQLQTSTLELLRNDCELERSTILNTLMISHENPRLAGYTLTRNRSMFLKTNGNVAWLYNCPEFHSSLQILNKCYNRIPILYEDEIHFVDPISRQTFTEAEEQLCSDKHSNLFQLDVDDDNSWVELTPQITKVRGPALFKPHIVIQQIANVITASIYTSIYTYKEMMSFWNSITFNSNMKGVLKHFTKSLIDSRESFSNISGTNYYNSRTIYLDSFISPDFFNNQFVETFGKIQYIIERCGIFFAAFLFIKLLIDIVLCLIRAMQINKITDASIHFGKALFAATFDLMSAPILTSIYLETNSENDNTDKNRERTMRVPKSEDTTRVTQSPPYENNRMQALTHENKSGYPNLHDENNKDENRNDHNVPTSPV